MKLVFPSLFPEKSFDVHTIRTVVADGMYVYILMMDGSYQKSIAQDRTLSEMCCLTKSMKDQIDGVKRACPINKIPPVKA